MNHPILHLQSRSYEKSTNQSRNLYSNIRNPLVGATAMSQSIVSSHKTHTKKGAVTKYGFSKGYIQVSPYYPATKIYLSQVDEYYVVAGFNQLGKPVHKSFLSHKDARSYLKEVH